VKQENSRDYCYSRIWSICAESQLSGSGDRIGLNGWQKAPAAQRVSTPTAGWLAFSSSQHDGGVVLQGLTRDISKMMCRRAPG